MFFFFVAQFLSLKSSDSALFLYRNWTLGCSRRRVGFWVKHHSCGALCAAQIKWVAMQAVEVTVTTWEIHTHTHARTHTDHSLHVTITDCSVSSLQDRLRSEKHSSSQSTTTADICTATMTVKRNPLSFNLVTKCLFNYLTH